MTRRACPGRVASWPAGTWPALFVAIFVVAGGCSRDAAEKSQPAQSVEREPASEAPPAAPRQVEPAEAFERGSTPSAKEERPEAAPAGPARRDGLTDSPRRKAEASGGQSDPYQRIELAKAMFEDSMASGQLSCAGADVHRRAICAIADEICALARGTEESDERRRRCMEGRAACSDANERYHERCGG